MVYCDWLGCGSVFFRLCLVRGGRTGGLWGKRCAEAWIIEESEEGRRLVSDRMRYAVRGMLCRCWITMRAFGLRKYFLA